MQIAHANEDGTVVSYTSYSHLGSIAEGIAVGNEVAADDIIGTVGRTGNLGPGIPDHLHFEVRTQERPGGGIENRINPLRVGLPLFLVLP